MNNTWFRYLEGGHESGFNHVTDPYENYKPKLFHCKGKQNVRCTQEKCVKESLNLGDVFILDKGLNLYVWMPPQSGRLERRKVTAQFCKDFLNLRGRCCLPYRGL